MLESVYRSYRELADHLDWKNIDCNDLFFGYIQYENELPMRDYYYAAIVCRYWGYSGRVYLQCNKHVPFEQCYDIVIDSINYVLKKRVWENSDSSLYQDNKAPDKAFHIALKRERGIVLANLNAEKRRTNFNTLSIDEMQENYKDSTDGLLFGSEADNAVGLKIFISSYINEGDIIDAIILDLICFSSIEDNFEMKISKEMLLLNENYSNYFSKTYSCTKEVIDDNIKKIKNHSMKYLRKRVKRLLYLIKKSLEEK